jgi:hypothetical protein
MRAPVLASLCTAAVLLSACGGDEQAAPTAPVANEPPTTTAAAETEPATTSTPKPKPKPALEDGRHFGYLKAARVTAEPREVELDLAYFLTGEEANAEAEERGLETPVPNDYLIVNDNPKLRTLPVAEDVVIDLLDWTNCCETRFVGDPARFETSFTAENPPSGRYRGRFTAYWLTVENGEVTTIEEQYLP